MARIHGGPDALGVPAHDFSTNANACGPCPSALAAVQAADATRYPDAGYTALRARLAAFHGVAPWRIVPAGSASEFIFRLTAAVAGAGGGAVCLPRQAYGDYAQAALAWGLVRVHEPAGARLAWACEPSSPQGAPQAGLPAWLDACATVVLDRAYEPLRLYGACSLDAARLERVWQLWSPNKALGLTGVRAAYAIAPAQGEAPAAALEALAPSWVLGAHGAALLTAWCGDEAQRWLTASLHTLRGWKARQVALCEAWGWQVVPGDANFMLCRAPVDAAALRIHGIKLRDCASFGLPGHWRLGVLAPASQDALHEALQAEVAA